MIISNKLVTLPNLHLGKIGKSIDVFVKTQGQIGLG